MSVFGNGVCESKVSAYLSAFAVALFVLVGQIVPAQAITVELDFSASGFGSGAPNDPVSGVITYEATALNAPITSLLSISLTIGTHTYSLADVDFFNFTPAVLIGGTLNGALAIQGGTDDFYISFDHTVSSGALIGFDYSVAGGDIAVHSFSSYALSEVSTTPLPGALPLFATGLGALGLMTWRRKRKAVAA